MRWRKTAAGAAPASPRSTRSRMLIAAIAGGVSVFSFAPFGWWPLQLLTLALLAYQSMRADGVRAAALVGWAFGFGWGLAGFHWLYVALNRFNGLPAPAAAISIALLAAAMALYAAMATGTVAWLRKRWPLPLPAATLLVFPACWAFFELVRGWLFTGFPWVTTGYAHNTSPLAGYAPVIGVYGISWLTAVTAGALPLLMHKFRYQAMALVAVIWLGGFALGRVEWTAPSGKPLSVRLVQGNISLANKFDLAHIGNTLRDYQQLVTAAQADLIAIPETGVPLFPGQLPAGYLDAYGLFARRTGSHVVLGIPLTNGTEYSNSVLGLAPSMAPPYRYDKHHLVPFGEFIPPGFRWFTNLMQIPLGDQTRGAPIQAPFVVRDQKVLPDICYENVFGEEIAEQVALTQATVLLNVSELAWYGESIAIPQHLQMSQMRTLETGRPMLSATNSGATVVISPRGEVLHALPYYQRGVLSATVQGMSGDTPYIRLQNKLFQALALLAIGLAWLCSRKRRG